MPLCALENAPDKPRSQLIVVTKSAGVFTGLSSPIEEAFTGTPKNEQRRFVPAYYSDLDIKPNTWFLLSDLFRPICLNEFILSSNARPLLDVIAETRTVAMLVQKTGS